MRQFPHGHGMGGRELPLDCARARHGPLAFRSLPSRSVASDWHGTEVKRS